jgi:hypothetical protein
MPVGSANKLNLSNSNTLENHILFENFELRKLKILGSRDILNIFCTFGNDKEVIWS